MTRDKVILWRDLAFILDQLASSCPDWELLNMEIDSTTERKRGPAMEILIPVAILVAWVVLQAWVLPRFGVKT